MEFALFNKILIVLINIIGIWLAFFVYSSNPKAKINRLFVLMTISMFVWVNFALFARLVNQVQLSLILVKTAWFITPIFFTLLYLLTIFLIQEEKKYWFLSKIILLLGIITAPIIGFTDLIIKGVKFNNGVLLFIYGEGIVPFLVIIIFIMVATLYPLFKKYFKFLENERKKIRYFLIGIFIFYLSNVIFNIFYPMILKVSQYYYIGDYSLIVFLVITAYGVIKYELFGIKIILTTLLVSLIAILLALDVFIFTQETSFQVLKMGILLLLLGFSYLLIKNVNEEIKLKEELQIVNKGLKKRVKERTKELGKEKKISEVHREIAEERARRLERWYQSTKE